MLYLLFINQKEHKHRNNRYYKANIEANDKKVIRKDNKCRKKQIWVIMLLYFIIIYIIFRVDLYTNAITSKNYKTTETATHTQ